jgi:hypothetical protein
MSYSTFSLALKSTIDYIAKQVADSKSLPFIDLTASVLDPEVVESDQPAICWSMSSLDEHPFDPLWVASFEIGAITMLDPSQYISLDITGALTDVFRVGASFDIRDYSGAEIPTKLEGRFIIISSGIAPTQQDQETNLRFIVVTIRASRHD